MMGGGMMGCGGGLGDRYGRYGPGGRYSSQLADGRKWHERARIWQTVALPAALAFADGQGGYGDAGNSVCVTFDKRTRRGARSHRTRHTNKGRLWPPIRENLTVHMDGR